MFTLALPTEGCNVKESDESDEARFEGSQPDWVTDSGRYLMKMVHNCSSNRQIGMILVAKCSCCICLPFVSLMLPCIDNRNSHICVLKFGDMFKKHSLF